MTIQLPFKTLPDSRYRPFLVRQVAMHPQSSAKTSVKSCPSLSEKIFCQQNPNMGKMTRKSIKYKLSYRYYDFDFHYNSILQ